MGGVDQDRLRRDAAPGQRHGLRGEVIDDKGILRTIAGTVVQRYMGVSEADADAAAEVLMNKRSAVVIHPERIVSWDHSKLGGTY